MHPLVSSADSSSRIASYPQKPRRLWTEELHLSTLKPIGVKLLLTTPMLWSGSQRTLPRYRRRLMAGLAERLRSERDMGPMNVMNGGLSVRWPDRWIARYILFADRAALVEKREAVRSLQSGPPKLATLAVTKGEQDPALNREAWAPRCSRLLVIWTAYLTAPPIYPHMARLKKSQQDIDRRLDEALNETFPASDPVSIGRNDHPGKPSEPPAEDKISPDKS